ncbi:MAG: 5-methyltetrahydropteroyltriglutamate--homocysteine S-methyltransferase [Alphaproteobacteria bacterium]
MHTHAHTHGAAHGHVRPPFRADHVGSLLRPAALRAAREKAEGDHHTRVRGSRRFKELEALENEASLDAIRLQEAVGLEAITDGEFRRRSWWQDFVLELDGTFIDFAEFAIDFADPSGHKLPAPVAHVDGKIKRSRSYNLDAYKFLRANTKRTPKVTMPSPPVVHFFGGRLAIDPKVYPDLGEFWADLARAYREEIADLAAAGCTYVQIDECIFALMCDPKFRVQLARRGDDPEKLLGTYADVINESIKDRPKNMVMAMHLCRGNNRGHWLGEGGYDYISDVLFNTVNVDAFFMEYDSPRAGDFTPLKMLPKGKTAVLGLVTSKSPALETADDIRRRIDEAAKYAPIGQLALSPQCGFASHFMGNPLTFDDERRKLDLVVRVADEVWGSAR